MDIMDWARALAALVGTLALLGLLAVAARRFNMLQPLRAGAERRLAVVESLMLDPRRRLVIVRDGAKEHLLLLSPFGDSKIETREGSNSEPRGGAPVETPSIAMGDVEAQS